MRVLCGADEHLAVSGRIIFLCFDFLGIDCRTNNQPSIQEINCALGYSFKVLKQGTRQVRKGGETEKNMEWIEKIYPRYKFNKDKNGNSIYGLLVVELQKRQ